jgi:hypothetical protein
MGGERVGQAARGGASALALLCLALALSGCGTNSNLFKSSPLDLFKSSSKSTPSEASGSNSTDSAALDIDCPSVSVRTGAGILIIGSKPGESEPAALDVRYQGSIIRTARECHVNSGIMSIKVGIEGRIITGPAGGPGTVDVPLRIAVVHEGINPKTVVSKFGSESVVVGNAVDRVTFTYIDPDVAFPLPQPIGIIDQYVVYVGFDPKSAEPEKMPPPPKRKPPAKRKSAAKPTPS